MRKLSEYGPSLLVICTALLVLLLGPRIVRDLSYEHTRVKIREASHRLQENTILEMLDQAYRDIALFVEPSVVHISAEPAVRDPRQPGLSTGSGWIYDDDGHVVTNYHVVRGAGDIEVQLSTGELRPAEIVGFDPSTDIAVLRIPAGRLHPAARADFEEPIAQGNMVFAFGSPFDFRFSMSKGIVSGIGRHVGVLDRGAGYENFIQVDAAINPGNSGGPLTNVRGEVIGMNTAIATGGSSRHSLDAGQFAGIGLAIPLDMIEPVVSQIIRNNGVVKKGFLGVTVGEIDKYALQQSGFVGDGVRIDSLDPNGPADQAGVSVGDIVTRVNGRSVGTVRQLQSVISSMLPGETVHLEIWRPAELTRSGLSEDLDIPVTLGRLDNLRARGELPADQSEEQIIPLGIAKMATATRGLAQQQQVPYRPGVMIIETVPGSELAASVDEGSIIIEINGRPVTDTKEFINELRQYDLRAAIVRGHDFGGHVRATVLLPDGRQDTAILRVRP